VKSSESESSLRARWPLLLILAATGLWFIWGRLDPGSSPPETVYEAGRKSARITVDAGSSRVLVDGFSPEALRYLESSTVPGELREVLSVYALSGDAAWDSTDIPAGGDLEITDSAIVFASRHAFLPDVRYHARLDLIRLEELLGPTMNREGEVLDTTFTLARPSGLQAESVTGVYPSADTLPQNLLKFYIHFSGPMTRGDVYRHITIRDENGTVIPDAFLELPQELWDPDATRLTILFDPGRIKRGLQRHNLMGVAFEPGRRYTLVVDTTMEDGNGLPLASQYRKSFTITEPDRSMPDHGQWKIIPPSAGSRQALELRLDEPLDHALLHRLIIVLQGDDNVAGAVETGDAERAWRFRPEEPWQPGDYRLEIGVVLEDLAGNNLISVFDVDLAGGQEQDEDADNDERLNPGSVITKEFEIRKEIN